MGKRKSSAKPPPKKSRGKLETTFSCPFCNAGTPWRPCRRLLEAQELTACCRSPSAENSVHCEMDRERNVGAVRCQQCQEQYAVKIHELSEPIDVYR